MRSLLLVPALALLLTGCSASPEATLRGDVEDVIAAANSNDGDGVRQAVDDLLSTVREQVGSGELKPEQGSQLRELALAVQAGADALDPEPAPSPTPSEPSEEPSPTPTEEEPSEEPSPTPTEEEPSEEPSPTPTEDDDDEEPVLPDPLQPSPSSEASPAAGTSPAAQSSPTPAPSPSG